MATLWFMFKGKLFPPAQVTTSFADQTVLVTGSNTGVGYQAALKYVQLGASTVILGVRSLGKGQQAASAIEATTDRKGVVRVWELDMSRFTSVDEFARRVDRELPRLDIAVLNAGVLDQGYKVSPDGWETMLQVNLLSTMLLALLLTPKLKASRKRDLPCPSHGRGLNGSPGCHATCAFRGRGHDAAELQQEGRIRDDRTVFPFEAVCHVGHTRVGSAGFA